MAESMVGDVVFDPASIIEARVVRRRFQGPTRLGDEGHDVYAHPEVVDVSGWRNAQSLEDQGYLRRLEYNEVIVVRDDGLLIVVAGAQAPAGGERASSLQATTEPGSPASSDDDEADATTAEVESGEADGSSDDSGADGGDQDAEAEVDEAEAEGEGGDDEPVPELVSLGGGWYNVVLEGAVQNQSPIQSKAAAQELADSL